MEVAHNGKEIRTTTVSDESILLLEPATTVRSHSPTPVPSCLTAALAPWLRVIATMNVYDIDVTTIDGRTQKMEVYRGKTLLIVNVASQCGFTPQYAGLQALHDKFGDKGFAVLGFPCDQFGHQEPGSEAEIAQFCTRSFGVTFPMFAKIDVNGAKAHPLYNFLKGEKGGILGTKNIKWNFTKFLVNREGKVVNRFAPTTKPEDIQNAIAAVL